jgi:hypothetical protein
MGFPQDSEIFPVLKQNESSDFKAQAGTVH